MTGEVRCRDESRDLLCIQRLEYRGRLGSECLAVLDVREKVGHSKGCDEGLTPDVGQEEIRLLTDVAESGVLRDLVLEFEMEPQRQRRAGDEENTRFRGERTLDCGVR